MWITSDRDNLQAIKLPEMDSVAQFSDNNKAQVSESDAQILIETVDHITESD